jgi:hypothetical protein
MVEEKRRLSPLATLVLQAHRIDPQEPYYALDVLGSGFSGELLEKLHQAYEELEEAGLVVPTDKVVRFFDDFFFLYTLAEGAEVVESSN